MNNNTAYLQKLPWVVPFGIAYGLAYVFLSPWFFTFFDIEKTNLPLVITNILYYIITYTAIAVVIPKRKEILIAFGIQVILTVLFGLQPATGSGTRWIFYYLLIPMPLTVFISLQAGWQKRTTLLYLGVLLAIIIFQLGFYVSGILYAGKGYFHLETDTWVKVLRVIILMAIFVTHIIMICELRNFMQGNFRKPEPLVLNLGNEYHKAGTFIAYWAFKTALLAIAVGAATFMGYYMGSNPYMSDRTGDYIEYIRISGAVSITGSIGLSLFSAWYLRKLLLEYFITYNLRSKLLYWLALFPFIGVISFLFMETNQVKQQNYNGKVTTIGNFATSSTTIITAVVFLILLLRLLSGLSVTGPTGYIATGLGSLLFVWMIYSRIGYYVNGIIILIALTLILIQGIWREDLDQDIILLFGILLFSLAQLVLFLPVYHFGKFSFTPAENPEPETGQPGDIFA